MPSPPHKPPPELPPLSAVLTDAQIEQINAGTIVLSVCLEKASKKRDGLIRAKCRDRVALGHSPRRAIEAL